VKKTAASATQFVKCNLLHLHLSSAIYNCSFQLHKRKFIAYLTSWQNSINSIFGYKLRTDYEQ